MAQTGRWRFGPFEADEGEYRLWRDGEVVALTRKSFALLVVLLARAGQLVTKAELFDAVWAGRDVSDAALARALRELRLALGDDATRPVYVETAHGLGLRFVAPVQAVSGAPLRIAAGAPPRLAGRAAELDALTQALAAADAGRRQLVLVSGPAGIGKTALVDAALASLHLPHWTASGRCVEQYGTAEAYLPLREALERLAEQAGAAAMREHLLRVAPGWLAQLPWLAHDADPASLQRALAGQSQSRLLREFAQALEMLSRERLVVLWIEDLHWCDPSSLDALTFLAGRRDAARLAVIGSLRPPQTPDAPAKRLLRDWTARDVCRELALAPLAAESVHDLVRSRLPRGERAEHTERVSPALAALVHRRSQGNPLFARAITDDLLAGGELVDDAGGGWTLVRGESELSRALPQTLRQLVEGQLAALSDDDRRVVEAAAVVGAEFAAAAVAAAIAGDAAGVEDHCERLVGTFFAPRDSSLWPDGSASAGYAFVHALYHGAVLERVPEGRRATWQRRIAERLERAYGERRADIATELAMRFEAARDAPRAIEHARTAAAAALARCAYREAADLLQRALQLAGQLPPAQTPRATLALLLPLGAALIATRGYASDQVEDVYRRTLALARELGAAAEIERALRGLWNVALVRGDLRQAAELAAELMARAEGDPGDTARRFDAHAKLGQTELHRGRFVRAQEQLGAALAMPLDATAAAREAPRVAGYYAWVLWYTGKADQAVASAARALALARAAANPHSSAFALGFVGFVHLFRGEWQRVDESALAQAGLAAEHDLAYWLAWSDLLRGLAAAVGRGDAAGLATVRSALEAFSAMGAAVGLAHMQCEHASACLLHGEFDAAHRALAAARELIARTGNGYHAAEVQRLQAEWLLASGSGRLDEALRAFERAAALARRQGALALEVRARSGCLRALRRHGRGAADETAQLAAVLAACSEGRDTADLREASLLLGAECGEGSR